MEEIIPPEWRLSERQKRILGYGSVGVAGLYFLYRAYKSDSLAALIELRERLSKGADSYSSSFVLSGDTANLLMKDMHQFLTSDSEELPQSLKQLLKLAKSQEFAEAATSVAAAATKGAFGAPTPLVEGEEGKSQPGMLERLMGSLTTDRGMDLVKLAVEVACRTSVETYCNQTASASSSAQPNFWQQLLEFGTTPEGEKLYSTCVGTFVREGTKVWMGSMEGVNAWEDFLGSLCKPERQAAVDRMTRSFVNELVVTFLRRSRSRGEGRSGKMSGHKQAAPPRSGSHQAMATDLSKDSAIRQRTSAEEGVADDNLHVAAASAAPAWAAAMVEAARHPEIRGLMLSMAKTATAEGVRTSMLTTRDILLGGPGVGSVILPSQGPMPGGTVDLHQQSNQMLGAFFLYVFMPVLFFLIGKRAAVL